MNRKTALGIVVGVVGLGLIVVLAWSIAGEPEIDPSIAFGDVTVEGDNLPYVQDPNAGDSAIGETAPTVSGSDWDGVNHTVGPDGRPKVLLFLAHWCNVCDAEAPQVQAWLDGGGLPDDVDLYAFTVRASRSRVDWPPQDWLEGHGWTVATIMDDEQGSADAAYGVVGTPFYVVLDGENKNLGRITGTVGPAGLDGMAAMAQASISEDEEGE